MVIGAALGSTATVVQRQLAGGRFDVDAGGFAQVVPQTPVAEGDALDDATEGPVIQVALLLDTSGSMHGLLD